MARKVVFEKSYIIDKSVDFIKENGIDSISNNSFYKRTKHSKQIKMGCSSFLS